MHLKNFSIITREGKTTLSPCYDLVNSTIVLKKQEEEFALPLRGTKKNLTHNILVNYLGMELCELTVKSIDNVLGSISASLSKWNDLIDSSFLSPEMKIKYHDLLNTRLITLKL
jgi:serine/threonine-protein kinase HipA